MQRRPAIAAALGAWACLAAASGCSESTRKTLDQRIDDRAYECGLDYHSGEGGPTSCSEELRENYECLLTCHEDASCQAIRGEDELGAVLIRLPYAVEVAEVHKLVAAVTKAKPAAAVAKAAAKCKKSAESVQTALDGLTNPQTVYNTAMAARDALLPACVKALSKLKTQAKAAWDDEPGVYEAVFAPPERVQAPKKARAKKEIREQLLQRANDCRIEIHHGEGEPACTEEEREWDQCILTCFEHATCAGLRGEDAPDAAELDACSNYCVQMREIMQF